MAPLWGASDADESKPKNLTTAEKKEVFANSSGWVREAGSVLSGNGNTSADPEVLVALRGLAVKLGNADITEIEFVTTSFDKSDVESMAITTNLFRAFIKGTLLTRDNTIDGEEPVIINEVAPTVLKTQDSEQSKLRTE